MFRTDVKPFILQFFIRMTHNIHVQLQPSKVRCRRAWLAKCWNIFEKYFNLLPTKLPSYGAAWSSSSAAFDIDPNGTDFNSIFTQNSTPRSLFMISSEWHSFLSCQICVQDLLFQKAVLFFITPPYDHITQDEDTTQALGARIDYYRSTRLLRPIKWA